MSLFKKEKTSPDARPPNARPERRSGRRVTLPIGVRIKVNDGELRDARVRDVNLPGLAVETVTSVKIGDRVNIGFEGYPEVSLPFALTGTVRRIVPGAEPGSADAMGIEIDREATSADALKNYRNVVRHYLHHKPLLEDMNQGYFEARCTSCDWIGRVGRRRPNCSRCGAPIAPV